MAYSGFDPKTRPSKKKDQFEVKYIKKLQQDLENFLNLSWQDLFAFVIKKDFTDKKYKLHEMYR
jgi:hypothetical protein